MGDTGGSRSGDAPILNARRAADWLCAVVLVVVAAAFFGWFIGDPGYAAVVLGATVMRFQTAVALGCLACGLLIRPGRATGRPGC